jgi:dTDP-glucose 4,6-dehydratase
LRDERILITGGTGFVGTWLVQSLTWANDRLGLSAQASIVTRSSPSFPSEDCRYIIHAAPDASLTRRVLEFSERSGAERILYTSSGAVYKHQTEYAQLKRESEALLAGRAVIARLFAFIGPYLKLDANFAAGNFIRDALKGGPIVVQGDGTAIRAYLYAGDLAAWLWTLLVEGEGTYDVGGDAPITIAELAHKAAQLTIPGSEVEILGQTSQPDVYVPDTRRARTELNLQTWTTIDESLRRTYNWLLT